MSALAHDTLDHGVRAEALDLGIQDLPTAEELGIDVTGMSPHRAVLLRWTAWLEKLRTDLKNFEEGRVRFLDALGTPAVTEERIRKLAAEDTSEVVAWLSQGGPPKRKVEIRSHERARLEKKLADDLHKREVALAAIDQADTKIDSLTAHITTLESRHRQQVLEYLLGNAHALVSTYKKQRAEQAETVKGLFGLIRAAEKFADGSLAQRGFGMKWEWVTRRTADYDRDGRPVFEHLGASVNFWMPDTSDGSAGSPVRWESAPKIRYSLLPINQDDLSDVSQPWLDLAQRLLDDPRAE